MNKTFNEINEPLSHEDVVNIDYAKSRKKSSSRYFANIYYKDGNTREYTFENKDALEEFKLKAGIK